MTLNLACDHRILYGADGARFLDRIRGLLAEPLGLGAASHDAAPNRVSA